MFSHYIDIHVVDRGLAGNVRGSLELGTWGLGEWECVPTNNSLCVEKAAAPTFWRVLNMIDLSAPQLSNWRSPLTAHKTVRMYGERLIRD